VILRALGRAILRAIALPTATLVEKVVDGFVGGALDLSVELVLAPGVEGQVA